MATLPATSPALPLSVPIYALRASFGRRSRSRSRFCPPFEAPSSCRRCPGTLPPKPRWPPLAHPEGSERLRFFASAAPTRNRAPHLDFGPEFLGSIPHSFLDRIPPVRCAICNEHQAGSRLPEGSAAPEWPSPRLSRSHRACFPRNRRGIESQYENLHVTQAGLERVHGFASPGYFSEFRTRSPIITDRNYRRNVCDCRLKTT